MLRRTAFFAFGGEPSAARRETTESPRGMRGYDAVGADPVASEAVISRRALGGDISMTSASVRPPIRQGNCIRRAGCWALPPFRRVVVRGVDRVVAGMGEPVAWNVADI